MIRLHSFTRIRASSTFYTVVSRVPGDMCIMFQSHTRFLHLLHPNLERQHDGREQRVSIAYALPPPFTLGFFSSWASEVKVSIAYALPPPFTRNRFRQGATPLTRFQSHTR